MSLLRVDSLSVRYAENREPAVDNLSFSMRSGASLGIVGESGAGKSQTALAILGLLPKNAAVSGSVRIDGVEVNGASPAELRRLRSGTVAMVFQDPATALNPYLRIGEQLQHILQEQDFVAPRMARKRCLALLERVGLPDPEKQYRSYPHQLSGGMRQRALIAAALVGNPQLIVADEPTTALDVTIQAQILRLLRDLQQELNTALLLIAHDLGVVARCCDDVLVMDGGRLIEQGPQRDVFGHPQQPHTVRLLQAVPRLDAAPPVRAQSAGDEVISVDDLCIRFPDRHNWRRREFAAVDRLSLVMHRGETLAIVGESGSGKTSLARCVAGLLAAESGTVRINGARQPWRVEDRDRSMRRQLQMVFQDPVSSLNPAMRVGRSLGETIVLHTPSLKGAALKSEIERILSRVGLDAALAERYPHELSGGQAQRIAIARALVPNPQVLICDEAFAALDGTVRRGVLDLLASLQQASSLTLVLITHDLGVVREIADRVIVMQDGKIVETASNRELFESPREPYTQSLLAAVPTLPGYGRRVTD